MSTKIGGNVKGFPVKMLDSRHPKGYAKLREPGGSAIYRRAYAYPLGNFVFLSIRYHNSEYLIGNGDEYMRGAPDEFALGTKIN